MKGRPLLAALAFSTLAGSALAAPGSHGVRVRQDAAASAEAATADTAPADGVCAADAAASERLRQTYIAVPLLAEYQPAYLPTDYAAWLAFEKSHTSQGIRELLVMRYFDLAQQSAACAASTADGQKK